MSGSALAVHKPSAEAHHFGPLKSDREMQEQIDVFFSLGDSRNLPGNL